MALLSTGAPHAAQKRAAAATVAPQWMQYFAKGWSLPILVAGRNTVSRCARKAATG
jgi:hypothetical protein